MLIIGQKVIPLVIINMILNLDYENLNVSLVYHLLVRIIWASLIGLTVSRVKLIMRYSSIIQISWIIIIIYVNEIIVFLYFLIYIIIRFNLVSIFNIFNINFINDLYIMKLSNYIYIYILFILLFSLAGIPPFFGFIIKWISVQSLRMMFGVIVLMILSSVIRIYFYIRLIFSYLLFCSITKKVNYKFINFNIKIPRLLILINWICLVRLFMYEII